MKSHKKEYQYDTVTEAIAALRNRGYTLDFNLEADQLTCAEKKVNMKAEHFHIDEFHRFEGNSNPDDMDIIYVISSKEGHKGILMAAFGTYADSASAEMLEKLKV
jgi:carbonic anhydrase